MSWNTHKTDLNIYSNALISSKFIYKYLVMFIRMLTPLNLFISIVVLRINSLCPIAPKDRSINNTKSLRSSNLNLYSSHKSIIGFDLCPGLAIIIHSNPIFICSMIINYSLLLHLIKLFTIDFRHQTLNSRAEPPRKCLQMSSLQLVVLFKPGWHMIV